MIKKKGTAEPERTAVVMNEANGFGHVEPLTKKQLQRALDPAWLTECRATRTTTEGSKA